MSKNKQAKKQLKITIVVILTIIFFGLITVLTIMFTEGNRFTPEGIVDTGNIRINIDPNNVSYKAYVDDEPRKVQDKLIDNLDPGFYNLKIQAEDYYDWQNEIEVRNGIISEVYIKLFPKDTELEQLTSTDIDDVFFSENGEYAYYVINNPTLPESEQGIWQLKLNKSQFIFNNSENQAELISPMNKKIALITDTPDYKIIPDPNNEKLLLTTSDNASVFTINIDRNTGLVTDIGKKLGFEPDVIAWFGNGESVIIQDNNILYEYVLATEEKKIIEYSPEKELIFHINPSKVYTVKNNNEIHVYESDKSEELILKSKLILPDDISSIALSKSNLDVALKSGDNYYYLDLDNEIIKKVETENTGNLSLQGISDTGNSIIFTDINRNIYTYNIEKIIAENDISVKLSRTNIPVDSPVRHVDDSDLLVFHNLEDNKLYVSSNDGNNKVVLIDQYRDSNEKYKFDQNGNSFVILLTTDGDGANELVHNLFQIDFNANSSGFSL